LATHLQRSALELLFVSRENERGDVESSRKVSAANLWKQNLEDFAFSLSMMLGEA
jgi:hypothetical protein